MTLLRVALLHLAPLAGQVAHNRRMVERAVVCAAEAGAAWIVTPELAISGYSFAPRIGTDWILPQPDEWMIGFCERVRDLRATVFLGMPERDAVTGRLYNTVFVIAPSGEIVGKQRKMNPLPVGVEGWSSAGEQVKPIAVTQGAVGVMICADAYPPTIAEQLRHRGEEKNYANDRNRTPLAAPNDGRGCGRAAGDICGPAGHGVV